MWSNSTVEMISAEPTAEGSAYEPEGSEGESGRPHTFSDVLDVALVAKASAVARVSKQQRSWSAGAAVAGRRTA